LQGLRALVASFRDQAPASFPIEACPRLYDPSGFMRPVYPRRPAALS
jgi:hypothetical protein